jgi:hypothetical protein
LGKFQNDHVAQDSTDRMAKIRLPAKLSREMRRKHGCKLLLGGAGASNIVTMFCAAIPAIASAWQRNIHDSAAGAAIRES